MRRESAKPDQEQEKPDRPYSKNTKGKGSSGPKQSVFRGTLEKKSALPVLKTLNRVSGQTPLPSKYEIATTREVSTEVIRDRIRPQLPQVWMPWTSTFGPVMTGTNYFQDGTNLDTVVNAQLGPVFKQMYSAIVRELEIVGNKFIRDTVLDNSGTITDSFGFWVSSYSQAFTTLRGLQGCLGMGNYNYSCSLIANSVNQNLFALEGALRLLHTFSVPPMLVRFLERMCGPIASGKDDPLIIAGVNSIAPIASILTPANVATMIAGAVSELQQCGAGSALLAPADAARICNIFSMAYGTPDIAVDKGIQTDPCTYGMHVWQAGTYHNSTSNLAFTWPNINVTSLGPIVPIVVPNGANGEAVHQLFSLWRTPVYSVDPIAGLAATGANVPSQIGWTTNTPSTILGTGIEWFNQSGAFANSDNEAAGPITYSYSNPESQLLPWVVLSGVAAADYSVDTRSWPDFNVVWVSRDLLVEETNYLLENMFLEPIRK